MTSSKVNIDHRRSLKRKADDDLRGEDDNQELPKVRKIVSLDTPMDHSTIVVDSSGNGRKLVTKNNNYQEPQVSSISSAVKMRGITNSSTTGFVNVSSNKE